ncbi:MAG: hypothetical protein KatS3mg115_2138 [Candidatus Poribacteria bacterium]|nr:MAG: hypothetical protein KatS3mg115_2138 [Candidatus Poribacteria bacterium]
MSNDRAIGIVLLWLIAALSSWAQRLELVAEPSELTETEPRASARSTVGAASWSELFAAGAGLRQTFPSSDFPP